MELKALQHYDLRLRIQMALAAGKDVTPLPYRPCFEGHAVIISERITEAKGAKRDRVLSVLWEDSQAEEE